MIETLDDKLLHLTDFQIRLMRNRAVPAYRVAAEPMYEQQVRSLILYEKPGLMEHYAEWIIVYRRLFPVNGARE